MHKNVEGYRILYYLHSMRATCFGHTFGHP